MFPEGRKASVGKEMLHTESVANFAKIPIFKPVTLGKVDIVDIPEVKIILMG